MSTPDASAELPQHDPASPHPAEPAHTEVSAENASDAAVTDAGLEEPGEAPAEPVVVSETREVTLQRSVRYGRVIIGTTVLAAMLAMLGALLFPVTEGADYTLGQAVGFMALIGAAIGLGLGGVLALILGAVARRSRGSGVAIQSDVR